MYRLDEHEAIVVDDVVRSHVRQQLSRLRFNTICSQTLSDVTEIRLRHSLCSERRH